MKNFEKIKNFRDKINNYKKFQYDKKFFTKKNFALGAGSLVLQAGITYGTTAGVNYLVDSATNYFSNDRDKIMPNIQSNVIRRDAIDFDLI